MRRRYLVLAIALAVAAGAIAGVWLALAGGGKHEPTRQAYLAEVSSVCQGYVRRLERIPVPTDPAAYGNIVSSVAQVLPVLRAQEAAMRAVRPPGALQPRLDRLFALERRSITALQPALTAARRRDAGGVATGLLRFSAARDQVHSEAVAIGIDCTVS